MTVRKIVTLPRPILRKEARQVRDFGSDLQTLIDDMVETMRDAPGVGLAAPQINVPLRVIAIEFGDEEDESIPPKLYTVVNPEIARLSEESVVGVEGCLSIPQVVGEVERAAGATIRGQTRHGQPLKLQTHGWLARIFQHEIDHLNGVLFVDKATRLWEPREEPEQEIITS